MAIQGVSTIRLFHSSDAFWESANTLMSALAPSLENVTLAFDVISRRLVAGRFRELKKLLKYRAIHGNLSAISQADVSHALLAAFGKDRLSQTFNSLIAIWGGFWGTRLARSPCILALQKTLASPSLLEMISSCL
jgi:hypothetical protein